jgi:hypothetical protein
VRMKDGQIYSDLPTEKDPACKHGNPAGSTEALS